MGMALGEKLSSFTKEGMFERKARTGVVERGRMNEVAVR